MQKHLVAAAVAIGLGAAPALTTAKDLAAPVKLTDAQLDGVTAGRPPPFVLAAGHGPKWMRAQAGQPQPGQPTTQVNFVIDDVQLTFNIGPNSPVNFAAVLQFAFLSQANQTGSASAIQAAAGR